MHKAMYERLHGTGYEIDDRDRELLAELTREWNEHCGGTGKVVAR